MISIDERTYLELKQLGMAGDSFNDVIRKVLKNASSYYQPKAQNVERIQA
jgi:predicted CopG family antitoxin